MCNWSCLGTDLDVACALSAEDCSMSRGRQNLIINGKCEVSPGLWKALWLLEGQLDSIPLAGECDRPVHVCRNSRPACNIPMKGDSK